MIVRAAIEKALEPKAYRSSGPTHLWVSEVGSCPRKVMFRVLGYESETEFPLELREKFQWGNIMEDETARALKEAYGSQLTTQLPLRTKCWSGKTDIVIGLESNHPTIIEHKTTGSKYWRKYGSPPSESHIAQLVLYGQLYKELYNTKPKLILYYRAWGNWAELELRDLGDRVKIMGQMDGEAYDDEVFINVTERRYHLEKYFASRELPPFVKTDECYFRGKPSCPFFNRCHKLSEKKPQNVVEWGLF